MEQDSKVIDMIIGWTSELIFGNCGRTPEQFEELFVGLHNYCWNGCRDSKSIG